MLDRRRQLAMVLTLVLLLAPTGTVGGQSAAGQQDPGIAKRVDWHYPDDGSWADDSPECAGRRQSPIDLSEAAANASNRLPIEFHYAPTDFEASNNGHTIELEDHGEANSIVSNGVEYKLLQFHFHSPGEHRIPDLDGGDPTGTHGAMVVHLVHQSADEVLAVVGVLMRSGAANPLVERIWRRPRLRHEERPTMIRLDPSDFLPADRAYYAASGSLTTPPCSQGVKWHVFQHTGEVSDAQVAYFTELFPLSVRNLQDLNGRRVLDVQ